NYLGGLPPNPVLLPQRHENSKIPQSLGVIFVPWCLCGKNLLAQLNSYEFFQKKCLSFGGDFLLPGNTGLSTRLFLLKSLL
ncbi:MAG: hypothetical protein KDD10_14125, partial [Phaeodactylibacter sp.]|nr:hypothetical protein [Phaeodactylibacter sp.]